MPLADVRVSVLDRAFLFGDAVYEVIRVYGGRAWKADEHLGRLAASLEAIKITGVDLALIEKRMLETLAASGVTEGLIYIQVTRGEARRSHCFPPASTPNQLIWVDHFDNPAGRVRDAGVSAITYPDIRWAKNHIKATSLLANCLAAQAAVEAGAVEAVLVDSQGFVSEGSHTSVFAVRGGKLLVAPDSANVLPGITKKQVLELARAGGIPIEAHRLKAAELDEIDELFLSGTPEEILGVVRVDDTVIGDGQPGPVTMRLHQAFCDSLSRWLNRP